MRALLLCRSRAAGAGEPRAAAERTAGQRKGGFCPRVCGPKGGDLAAHVENGPARACRGRRSVARGQPPCESRVASWRGPPRLQPAIQPAGQARAHRKITGGHAAHDFREGRPPQTSLRLRAPASHAKSEIRPLWPSLPLRFPACRTQQRRSKLASGVSAATYAH